MILPSNGQFVGGNLLGHLQPSLAQPDEWVKEEDAAHKGGSKGPKQVATPNVRQFMSENHGLFRGIQPTPCFCRDHDGRSKDANQHGTAAARDFKQLRLGSQVK